MEDKPRLRPDLEFFPVEQGDQKFVFVRDHLGLVKGRLMPIPVFQFMLQLNGNNTIRDLQAFLTRKTGGVLVGKEEVQNMIKQFDSMFLLDTDRYRGEKKRIEQEFSQQSIRPCSHCGKSYPDDPEKLKDMINEIIESADNGRESNGDDNNIRALIAPHIDISIGARVYGDVYKRIKGLNYSQIIIIGVGHQIADNFFCLTEKDFETPLGKVRTNKRAVRMLQRSGSNFISSTDFAHKEEHSIEFQLIFLQHLIKGEFTIIPILCGPAKLFLEDYSRRAYLSRVRPFIEILSGLFSEKKTLLVAGVDLSHIGPKFGHDSPASYIEAQAKRHDQALIEALLKMQPEAFWDESRRVEDRFNVCGFSAMACLLEVLLRSSAGRVLDYNACVIEMLEKTIKGELLNYHMWHESSTGSAVSFCGIKFSG